MAFYSDDEEQKDNASGMNASQEEQQPQSGGPVQLSGQSASISTGQQSAPSSSTAPKSTSSGASPGFQNYAKANQGKAQDSLNSAVAQNVANQGQAAKSAINQATTSFNQRADAGTLANRQNALQDVSNTLSSARNLTAGSSVDQNRQNRFKEVINAKYQGPESLRQAGLYNKAADKVGTAANTIKNTGTATGREELLKNMYQQRADYTSGIGKLDSALLNASQSGVKNLQDTAKAQGNVNQQLDQAQIGSTNLSKTRTNEINDIRNQAKKTFGEQKTAEEQATEARLTAMTTAPVLDETGKPVMKADGTPLTQWEQLPEHFKGLLSNKDKMGEKVLNNKIAEVQATPEYQAAAAKTQAAAQALKNIPRYSSGLNAFGQKVGFTNPAYAKAEKAYQNALAQQDAGITDLKNSYNKDAVFLNQLESGMLGIKSGEGLYNMDLDSALKAAEFDKNRLVSKDEQARQAALSSLAGLDQFNQLDTNLLYNNADLAGTQSATDALDVARFRENLNASEKNFRDSVDRDIVGMGAKKNKTSGKKYYAEASANLKDVFKNAGYNFDANYSDNVGQADVINGLNNSRSVDVSGNPTGIAGAMDGYVGTMSNMGNGQSLGANALDFYGTMTGINALTGMLGGGSLSSALGMGGANSRGSKNKATELANEDLKNKVTDAVKATGFNNRVAVSNDKSLDSRATALQALIDKMDKTNS